MKKTNVYFSHSVSWSFKSLLTGVFLLGFMALANLGTAQLAAPTPADILPPLVSKSEALKIAQDNSDKLIAFIHTIPNMMDPNNKAVDAPRALYNAWQFIINEIAEPTFDMPLILAQLYGIMHTQDDGTATHSYGFYAKSWSKDYTDIVNQLKK